jgi:hypothetical protein
MVNASEESRPSGPDFNFTLEGWSWSPENRWSGGVMEYWNIGAQKLSVAGGLFSALYHLYKNRSDSTKPNTFTP